MGNNQFVLTSEDEKALHKMIESGFDDLSMRAQIILDSAHGKRGTIIAKELNITVQTVSKWKQRFLELGVVGLKSDYGPKRNDNQNAESQKIEEEIKTILKTEEGSQMTVAQLGEAVGVSPSKAYRIKRKVYQTASKRQTSWTYNTVDLQMGNSPYMIGLYLKAGVCAIILCNTIEMLDGMTIHGSLSTRNAKFIKDLERSTSTLRLSDTLVSSINYLPFHHSGEGLSANTFLTETIDCWPDEGDYRFSVIYMADKPMRYDGYKLHRIQYFQYQEFDTLVQKVQGSFLGLEQKNRLDNITNILKFASNYLLVASRDSDPYCWHMVYGDFSPLLTTLTAPDCDALSKESIGFLRNDIIDFSQLGFNSQTDNETKVCIVIYMQEADGQISQKVVPTNAILPEVNEDLLKTPEGIKVTLDKLDREMTQLAKRVDYMGREMYLENIKKNSTR